MRLIDADELKKDIAENYVFIGFVELLNDFMEVINNAPAVDPVKHGRWSKRIAVGGFHEKWGYTCSECGRESIDLDYVNYCPYCGARMDGENT